VRFPYLDHPRPLAFAHRGGAIGAPENTMRAFERTARLGFAYIETDVHATADGELVVFHDDTLDRLTDLRGPVSALPYREVAKARVLGTEPLPLLEDVLAAWPGVRFNIDVKEAAAIAPFARALDRTGARERVCVASFSQGRLRQVRAALGPGVCTSLTRSGVAALKITSLFASLAPLARFTAGCVQVPPFYGAVAVITPSLLRAAHAHGMQVHAWTIDDPVEMRRLLDLGVDGIMTDDPAALRDVLIERGQWHPRTIDAGEPAP
jgi:glycerophosphoryl diester phosphodiesterase